MNKKKNKKKLCTLSVCLGIVYLAETEFFFAESTIDKAKK